MNMNFLDLSCASQEERHLINELLSDTSVVNIANPPKTTFYGNSSNVNVETSVNESNLPRDVAQAPNVGGDLSFVMGMEMPSSQPSYAMPTHLAPFPSHPHVYAGPPIFQPYGYIFPYPPPQTYVPFVMPNSVVPQQTLSTQPMQPSASHPTQSRHHYPSQPYRNHQVIQSDFKSKQNKSNQDVSQFPIKQRSQNRKVKSILVSDQDSSDQQTALDSFDRDSNTERSLGNKRRIETERNSLANTDGGKDTHESRETTDPIISKESGETNTYKTKQNVKDSDSEIKSKSNGISHVNDEEKSVPEADLVLTNNLSSVKTSSNHSISRFKTTTKVLTNADAQPPHNLPESNKLLGAVPQKLIEVAATESREMIVKIGPEIKKKNSTMSEESVESNISDNSDDKHVSLDTLNVGKKWADLFKP